MIAITELNPEFEQAFPQLAELFKRAPLTVDEGVSRVTLHGSRGPKGGADEDSDLDLCLIVDRDQYPDAGQDEELVKEIMFTTLAEWRQKPKLDIKVVFDTRGCLLKCFAERMYNPTVCTGGGFSCFGVYKMQDGSTGYSQDTNFNIRYLYPCITVWKNPLSMG